MKNFGMTANYGIYSVSDSRQINKSTLTETLQNP